MPVDQYYNQNQNVTYIPTVIKTLLLFKGINNAYQRNAYLL